MEYSSELSCSWYYDGMYGFGGAASFLPSGYSSSQAPSTPSPLPATMDTSACKGTCAHVYTATHTHIHKHEMRLQVLKSKPSWVRLEVPGYIRMKEQVSQHVFQCEKLTFKHPHYTVHKCHMIKGEAFDKIPDEKKKDTVIYFKWSWTILKLWACHRRILSM